MKSPKRIVALLLAGFLAFAPPGTMIFLLALVVGFAGTGWTAAAAAALCLGAVLTLLLLRRRRRPSSPRR
jgi:membrane protein implicated in regulation of membrane protease activity